MDCLQFETAQVSAGFREEAMAHHTEGRNTMSFCRPGDGLLQHVFISHMFARLVLTLAPLFMLLLIVIRSLRTNTKQPTTNMVVVAAAYEMQMVEIIVVVVVC